MVGDGGGQAAKLWVTVGGDVGQAQGVLVQFDRQMRQTAANADRGAKQTASSLSGIDRVAGRLGAGLSALGVGMSFAGVAAGIVTLGKMAFSLDQQREQAANVRKELQAYSGSAANATAATEALLAATDHGVDRLSATAMASKLLGMGLAQTSEQVGQLARMAVMLGDKTLSVQDRMASWNAMLANQSIERLDTFGISSGRVRQRIEELQAADAGLAREQAFVNAVLEIGAGKLADVEAAGVTAATEVDKLTASWQNMRQALAEKIAPGMSAFSAGLRDIMDNMRAGWESKNPDQSAALAGLREQLALAQAIRDKIAQGEAVSLVQRGIGTEARIEALKREIAEIEKLPANWQAVQTAQDNLAAASSRVAAAQQELNTQLRLNNRFGAEAAQGALNVAKADEEVARTILRVRQEASNTTGFDAWGDAGVREALRVKTATATAGVEIAKTAAKATTVGTFTEPTKTRWGLYTDWAQHFVESDAGSSVQEWLDAVNEGQKTSNKQVWADYDRQAQAATSRVEGYISEAINAGKGLFDLTGQQGNGMAPGQNGPFENYFRALDIAKQGAASPWASVLGMDQETATRLAGQFQQGLLTPEVVGKLIDVEALKRSAQMQEQAQALTSAFAEQVAAAAGVDNSVTRALLGVGSTDQKALESATAELATGAAAALTNQAKAFEDAGRNVILGVARGAASAKIEAVKTVEDIARAMVAAMNEVLQISSPSQVFARSGYNAILGIAVGGERGAGAAVNMVRDIAQAMTRQASDLPVTFPLGVIGAQGPAVPGNIFTPQQAGTRSGGRMVYVSGDNYHLVVSDQNTAALTAALIADSKAQRLNASMGG